MSRPESVWGQRLKIKACDSEDSQQIFRFHNGRLFLRDYPKICVGHEVDQDSGETKKVAVQVSKCYSNNFAQGLYTQAQVDALIEEAVNLACSDGTTPETSQSSTTTTEFQTTDKITISESSSSTTSQIPETTSSTQTTTHTPICTPPEFSFDKITWNACHPYWDGASWYGITNEELTFSEAAEICTQTGGHIVAALNMYIDSCVQYTAEYQGIAEETIMMSGRKDTSTEGWAWCPFDSPQNGLCAWNPAFDYFNWFQPDNAGDCMGVLRTFYEGTAYTRWMQFECSEEKRAMCRLDCNHYKRLKIEHQNRRLKIYKKT